MSSQDWKQVGKLGKKIGCTTTDCDNDLHCFRRERPRNQTYRLGVCKDCGADLIDWTRMDKQDLKDSEYTFKALKFEFFRHHYWHKEIDEKAIKRAEKDGLEKIRPWAVNRLNRYVKPPRDQIYRDGIQTPLDRNIVFYAQHALGLCCRKCIEEWYGIDRNRELSEEEIQYFVDLIMLYVEDRLPHIE